MKKINAGQSIIEYVVILAIAAVLSVAMIGSIPGYFSSYVSTATGSMR